jgi:hypothetical protein
MLDLLLAVAANNPSAKPQTDAAPAGAVAVVRPSETTPGAATPPQEIGQSTSQPQPAANDINDQQTQKTQRVDAYPYASIQAGVGFPNALSGNFRILNYNFTNTLDLDTGFNGELAVGYKFPVLRTDLSVGYSSFNSRTQTITAPAGLGSVSVPGKGSVDLLNVMINGYYDIPIWSDRGRRVKLNLEPLNASPDQDYSTALETWDPTANNNSGAWITYKPDTYVAIPYQTNTNSSRRDKPENLLVRVAITNDNTADNDERFRLIVTNRDDDSAYAVATIKDDGTGTVYATAGVSGSTAAVSPATDQRPDTPLVLTPGSSDSVDTSLTARTKDDRRSIRINNINVSERSTYAVFSVQVDPIPSRWSPYIGAGIGYGNLTTPGCALSKCSTFQGGSAGGFAYQGKLGLSYRATDTGFLFLEGGYLGLTGTNIANVSYDSFGTWRLNLGWRQRF